jgi:tetratricopeptide (TPR) repeat protein
LDLRLQAVSQQLSTNSINATLWLERADLHRQHRDFLPALADLTTAEQLRPRWAPVALQRARVLADAGQLAGAIKAASECLTLDEGNADARVIRARCCAELGQLTAAIADMDLVLAAPARPLPDLYLERARWQSAMGKTAAAVQGLDAGMVRLGRTPSLLLPTIEYAQQAGDITGALARLEQARRFMAGPDYECTRSDLLRQSASPKSSPHITHPVTPPSRP